MSGVRPLRALALCAVVAGCAAAPPAPEPVVAGPETRATIEAPAPAPVAPPPAPAPMVEWPPIEPVAAAPGSSPSAPAPAAQAPVTQAPVAQAPVTQAPVAQAPVTQAPVAQAPAAQAPAAQAPVAQAPVAQAPVAQAPAAPQVASVPPPEPAPPPPPQVVVVQEITAEEREFAALLADLQRYAGLAADDLRRELAAQTQAMNRTRADAVRIRVGVLHTLTRQGAQDDQRALVLFEAVSKGSSGTTALKHLAAVLSAQVAERVRAVREEQARSEAAIQKLEALRAMERSLMRDRLRSGGGGGAGSGGGN